MQEPDLLCSEYKACETCCQMYCSCFWFKERLDEFMDEKVTGDYLETKSKHVEY